MFFLHAFKSSQRLVRVAGVLAFLATTWGARAAAAATIVVTPGEQNTQSGENGCATAPCAAGHWLHYPELLQVSLGAGYTVQNNGDGGAVLGCDATTATVAGGDSFCKSSKYTASIAMAPGIAIIGPFGEHDQRVVTKSAANHTAVYNATAFENAYEGLVQDYLKLNTKVFMMTPIDLKWNATALAAGEDIVKDLMLPASIKVAQKHNLTVIDTYTAITGTPQLVTQYYGNDGQVNQAGQQKMADLILAALNSNAGGGAGGAGGMGGAAGAASSVGGAGMSGGGSGGVAGGAGSAGAASGGGGSGGVSAGAAGTPGAAGSATAGASGAPAQSNPTVADDSSGCSVTRHSQRNPVAASLLLVLGILGVARRRRVFRG